jgi:hypothetical protein
MVSYFSNNKGNLSICEDSLTSVVFDTLKYLPTEIFWRILKNALYHDKFPSNSGELISITFWGKWDSSGTINTNYVEPDVFLRFDEFDIIIEAKRYNDSQQNNTQIENEITAYFNEYENDNKQLYFVQLGGLHNREDEQNKVMHNKRAIKDVIIGKTDWSRLLHQISIEKEKIRNYDLSIMNAYCRILEDSIKGFELHQYYKKLWLKDLHLKSSINTYGINKLFDYARKYK